MFLTIQAGELNNSFCKSYILFSGGKIHKSISGSAAANYCTAHRTVDFYEAENLKLYIVIFIRKNSPHKLNG